MATINEIIASIEVELEAAKKRRLKAQEELKLHLEQAKQEGRSALSEEERERMDQLWSTIDTAKTQVQSIRVKLDNARKIKKEEDEGDTKARTPDPETRKDAPRSYEDSFRVTREERTYTPESDPRGQTFLRDVCRQYLYQDVGAATRLSRHMQEERVERGAYLTRAAGDTTTAEFTGLVVPQYLVDMVAPAVAGLRPFADIANKHPLPADGMSVNISRITTASSVALQSSELGALGAQTVDDTLLTVSVQTAGGTQTVSRQAIDRGNGIEDTILQDLFARYHTNLDSTLLNQGTNGMTNVATEVTYDDTDPTAAELYPKVMGAAAGVEAALLGMGFPTHAVMHSRRWYWLAKEMTTSWPFINSAGIPVEAAGVNLNQAYNSGQRGVLPNGLVVIVDNNIATDAGAGTEDEIYVVPARECHLWEDSGAPAFIRAEQPSANVLGVLLVVYGYFAYTFGRYANGMQKVAGTGLIAPTF